MGSLLPFQGADLQEALAEAPARGGARDSDDQVRQEPKNTPMP